MHVLFIEINRTINTTEGDIWVISIFLPSFASHATHIKVVCGVLWFIRVLYMKRRKNVIQNEKQKDDDDLQHFCVYPYLLQAKTMCFHFLPFQQHSHIICIAFLMYFFLCECCNLNVFAVILQKILLFIGLRRRPTTTSLEIENLRMKNYIVSFISIHVIFFCISNK